MYTLFQTSSGIQSQRILRMKLNDFQTHVDESISFFIDIFFYLYLLAEKVWVTWYMFYSLAWSRRFRQSIRLFRNLRLYEIFLFPRGICIEIERMQFHVFRILSCSPRLANIYLVRGRRKNLPDNLPETEWNIILNRLGQLFLISWKWLEKMYIHTEIRFSSFQRYFFGDRSRIDFTKERERERERRPEGSMKYRWQEKSWKRRNRSVISCRL